MLLCTTQWCSSNGLEESNGAFTFCFASCRIRYLLEKINALKLLANKGLLCYTGGRLHVKQWGMQRLSTGALLEKEFQHVSTSNMCVCANESVPYIHLDVRSMCDLSIGSTTLEIYT